MSHVRHATPDDLDSIVAMGAEFFAFSAFSPFVQFDPDSTRRSLEALIQHGIVLVAEVDGVVVGGLAGTLTTLWFNQGAKVAAELGWWVSPAHRGGSAGIKLLRRFEQWAQEQGAMLISMSDLVVDGEAPAGRLFDKLGYTVVERSHAKKVN